jgi:hypothetical protein
LLFKVASKRVHATRSLSSKRDGRRLAGMPPAGYFHMTQAPDHSISFLVAAILLVVAGTIATLAESTYAAPPSAEAVHWASPTLPRGARAIWLR